MAFSSIFLLIKKKYNISLKHSILRMTNDTPYVPWMKIHFSEKGVEQDNADSFAEEALYTALRDPLIRELCSYIGSHI